MSYCRLVLSSLLSAGDWLYRKWNASFILVHITARRCARFLLDRNLNSLVHCHYMDFAHNKRIFVCIIFYSRQKANLFKWKIYIDLISTEPTTTAPTLLLVADNVNLDRNVLKILHISMHKSPINQSDERNEFEHWALLFRTLSIQRIQIMFTTDGYLIKFMCWWISDLRQFSFWNQKKKNWHIFVNGYDICV